MIKRVIFEIKNFDFDAIIKKKGVSGCTEHSLGAQSPGSNAKHQDPTIKQHAIEVLEHTHQYSNMIKIEDN